MTEEIKTYNIKVPSVPTALGANATPTYTLSPAQPHAFFRKNAVDESVTELTEHQQRFNALLNAAARKRE